MVVRNLSLRSGLVLGSMSRQSFAQAPKKGQTCLVKKSDKCAESWLDYSRRRIRRMPFSIQPPAGHSLLSPAVIGAFGSAA